MVVEGVSGKADGYRNQVRVIGGRWRGRRLNFPSLPGLRPTPDRVRETLFNWLTPWVGGARCLDLFAGSGALGIEALSRGAAAVVFVERQRLVVERLRQNLVLLGAEGGRVEQADTLRWLRQPGQPFDLVFLDPPFDQDLLPTVCAALELGGWLAPEARIYVEWGRQQTLALPANWAVWREQVAGRVAYRLLIRSA